MVTDKSIRKGGYPGNPKNPEHREWIGRNWDIHGAHQFNVMFSLGLREKHDLLDIGCGSLRGGRFFLVYLLPSHYYAIEPEKWCLEAGIKHEVGQDLIDIKKPCFDYNEKANLSVFKTDFDYILAYSIFFHAPKIWIEKCLKEVKKVLKKEGVFAATVMFKKDNNIVANKDEWHYPAVAHYKIETIREIVQKAGLKMKISGIKHATNPKISWIIITHETV